VEWCGVPRFVFSDFPLGNPMGRPFDAAMQREVLALGLDLLATATAARTTVVNPHVWREDQTWKDRVLTKAQPFLSEDATEKWLKRKQAYRDVRATGSV
jgi:hypothetical protein